MATRDVILRALQDWRRSGEAPLYLQAALNAQELGLLAEVAARAVAVRAAPLDGTNGIVERTQFSLRCTGCGKPYIDPEFDFDTPTWMSTWEGLVEVAEEDGWICRPVAGVILCGDCQAAPVGTPAEAKACAGRSGLGEVG